MRKHAQTGIDLISLTAALRPLLHGAVAIILQVNQPVGEEKGRPVGWKQPFATRV